MSLFKREKSLSKQNQDELENINENENDQTRPTTAM
jgi:hypothetical protein